MFLRKCEKITQREYDDDCRSIATTVFKCDVTSRNMLNDLKLNTHGIKKNEITYELRFVTRQSFFIVISLGLSRKGNERL